MIAGRTNPRASLGVLIASRLIAVYLRLVYWTSRWRIEDGATPEALARAQGPVIGVFWHGRFAAMPHIFRHIQKAHVLISAHRDGELIAQVMAAMGFATVRGSTARLRPGETRPVNKGGAAALRAMLRILRDGGHIGITPDGPRGPRMRVSPGTITLAALSGAPLMPFSFSASFAIRFNSWDRFILPLPFGRIWIAVGEPLNVARDADTAALECAQSSLEERLNHLTQLCDRHAGKEPVLPAPAPTSAPARALETSP